MVWVDLGILGWFRNGLPLKVLKWVRKAGGLGWFGLAATAH
jgi:hypothetical protein